MDVNEEKIVKIGWIYRPILHNPFGACLEEIRVEADGANHDILLEGSIVWYMTIIGPIILPEDIKSLFPSTWRWIPAEEV